MLTGMRRKGRGPLVAAACILSASVAAGAAWHYGLLPLPHWLPRLVGLNSSPAAPERGETGEESIGRADNPPNPFAEFGPSADGEQSEPLVQDESVAQTEPVAAPETLFETAPVQSGRRPQSRPAIIADSAESSPENPFESPAEDSRPSPRPVRTPQPAVVATADFETFEPEPSREAPDGRYRRDGAIRQTAGETKAPAKTKPKAQATPTAASSSAELDLREVDRLREAGDDRAALKLLSQAYWKQPKQRGQIQPQLDELAQRVYFSPQPHYFEPYVIQPGDQLRKVANKYHLTWQYLAKLNGADPKKIRPGQRLKVVEGPFSAVVDLSDFELTIHCHGNFVRKYRVGTGKDGSSPIGEFIVKDKLEDPTYYGPNGDVKAHDDPLNPLGERWIDIGNSFGIHGTIEPESIGRSESKGCIRMLNSDVEEVYDLLTVGSPVRIQR